LTVATRPPALLPVLRFPSGAVLRSPTTATGRAPVTRPLPPVALPAGRVDGLAVASPAPPAAWPDDEPDEVAGHVAPPLPHPKPRRRQVTSVATSTPVPKVADEPEDVEEVVEVLTAEPTAEPVRVPRRRVRVVERVRERASLVNATPDHVGDAVEPETPFANLTEFERLAAEYEEMGIEQAFAALGLGGLSGDFASSAAPPSIMPATPEPPPRQQPRLHRPTLGQSRRRGIGEQASTPSAGESRDGDGEESGSDDSGSDNPGSDDSGTDDSDRDDSGSDRSGGAPAAPQPPQSWSVPGASAPVAAERGTGERPPPVRLVPVEPTVRVTAFAPPAQVEPHQTEDPPPRGERPHGRAQQPRATPVRPTAEVARVRLPVAAIVPPEPDPVQPFPVHPREPVGTVLPPAMSPRVPPHLADPVAGEAPEVAPDAAPEPREPGPAPGADDRTGPAAPEPVPVPPPPPAVPAAPAPARPTAVHRPPDRVTGVPEDIAAVFRHGFGVEVRDVPVLRGPAARDRATAAGARAVTAGGWVHLPADHGELTEPKARGLLAHEVTHALQQRALGHALPAEDSPEGRELEREARAVEHWFTGALPEPPVLRHRSAPAQAAPGSRPPEHAPAQRAVEAAEPSAPERTEPTQMLSWTPDGGFAESVAPPGVSEQPGAPRPPVPDPPSAPEVDLSAVHARMGELDAAVAELREWRDNYQPTLAMDRVARGVYPHLRARLRAELIVDRERAGALADSF
jgi:hypothetical protein